MEDKRLSLAMTNLNSRVNRHAPSERPYSVEALEGT